MPAVAIRAPMYWNLLESFCRVDSPIRRLPAWFKLALALSLVVLTVSRSISDWTFFLGFALGLGVVAAVSRIPPGFLLRRLLLLEPLVLGVAVLAWFQPQGGRVFLGIIVKSSLCLFTMILLSNTTPFVDLLRVLQRLRVPGLLITTLALMYRYLFVLVEEAQRLRRARAARLYTRRRWPDWNVLGGLIGQLFVRSTERAERIYSAMCARGWK